MSLSVRERAEGFLLFVAVVLNPSYAEGFLLFVAVVLIPSYAEGFLLKS